MLPGQMSPVAFNKAIARLTNDVIHLQGGPLHIFFNCLCETGNVRQCVHIHAVQWD